MKTCRVTPPKTRARYFLSRLPLNTCIQVTCEEIRANAPVIRAWLWAARTSLGALGCFSIIDRRFLILFARKNDSFWRRAGLGGTLRAFRGARVVDDVHVGCGTDNGTREAPNNRATPPKRGHFPLLQGDSQALGAKDHQCVETGTPSNRWKSNHDVLF